MDNTFIHTMSTLLVIIGLSVMIISIQISIRINRIVSPEIKKQWSVISGMMIAFLVGYTVFLVLQVRNVEKYHELIAGLILLGGAMFVLLVMRLMQNTMKLANRTALSLEDKVREYRQVSEELRHSRANLKSIFDNAIPLCITNSDFEIVRANDAYYDVFGRNEQESHKQKCFDSRPGENCHTEGCPLSRIMEGENEVICNTTKSCQDGSKSHFIITGRPFLDANNETIGIVESFQDVSDWKHAEEAKEDLIEELQKSLEEVNLLSGFLPICASCKKVRDDQGYWNQIESYIREHSGVEFSHGICPDCAKRLYPGTFEKISNERG